jgi:N-methylhydantoinase A
MAKLKEAFEISHEALYAYNLPEQQPVLVNARVTTVGVLPELPVEPVQENMQPADAVASRDVYLDGWTPAKVYQFSELVPGQVVVGPALVESESTTVLLRPGDQATTTPQRWLDIEIQT